jgi:hypothetical protein
LDITGGAEGSTIERKWLGAAAAADASPTVTKTAYTPLSLEIYPSLPH